MSYTVDTGNPYFEHENLSYLVWTNPPRDLDTSCGVSSWFEDRSPEVIARWMTLFGGFACAIPFRVADHGSYGWSVDIDVTYDTPSGYVVIDSDKAGETNDPDAVAHAEFSEYAHYLRGDVFGYVVAEGTPEEDSCWGFYGEEWAREAIKESAEYAYTASRERAIKRGRALTKVRGLFA